MSSAGPSVNLAEDNLAAGCQVLSSRKGKHTSVCKGTWAGGSVTPGSREGGAKPGGGCAGGLTSATLWPPTSAWQTAHSAASDSQLRLLQSEMATLPGATIPGEDRHELLLLLPVGKFASNISGRPRNRLEPEQCLHTAPRRPCFFLLPLLGGAHSGLPLELVSLGTPPQLGTAPPALISGARRQVPLSLSFTRPPVNTHTGPDSLGK